MKPFYKSISIALALNFPEARGADQTVSATPIDDIFVIVSPPTNASAATAVDPLTLFDDCSKQLTKIVDDSLMPSASLSYPLFYSPLSPFLSSVFIPRGFARPLTMASLQPVHSVPSIANIQGWLSATSMMISPGEAFRIIDALPEDVAAKLTAKSKINEIAVKFFGGLLKSTFWTLSPAAEFPYRVIDLKGDESLSFIVRSSPLEGTDAAYNTFACNLYEQLITGINDLKVLDAFNTSPAPKDSVTEHAIAMTPQLLSIFASFHRTLINLLPKVTAKATAVVDNRFAFMRAVAHSLVDFNRADSSLAGRLYSSASHYASGTSLVENAAVSLSGELRSLSNVAIDESPLHETPSYIEVRNATKTFLNQLLSVWSRPFVESVKNSGRIVIISSREEEKP